MKLVNTVSYAFINKKKLQEFFPLFDINFFYTFFSCYKLRVLLYITI